ncbi:DivIVA domain-containing protein [Hymenobacter nivis]|uniref:Diviva domain containing protein n=1 Tax=Hymenobacter nivis TaxID=1850093 RepID=A0A2Z3GHA1_9BACT|nr:DivIVA domain-containing protein [Hymenobacter nivis]AWM33289.1 diviva domain containing protein [Hymenobacter nivis]
MKLTALDIRQKTFEKSFRGVDRDEVQAFLTTVSQQWERLGDENRELRLKLEHAQQDVQKMREVESSLYRTLKTAEDTGHSITEQAQREAALHRREAQLQAEHALAEARQRARAIVDEAYQTAEKTVADMQRQASGLGQECQQLEQQFDGLVRDLQRLAADAVAQANKAGQRPKGGAVAILSRAASVKVERPTEPAASKTPSAMFTASASILAAPPAPASPPSAFVDRPDQGPAPAAYNPKPGQQPDPDQAPGPDIERPNAPAENPGIAPAPNIEQPAPSQVPDPAPPYVEPVAPDIVPVGPNRPEIGQPSPVTHPGQPMGAVVAEKSFFDEI